MLVTLAAGVLVLAGCSGSDEPSGSAEPAPDARAGVEHQRGPRTSRRPATPTIPRASPASCCRCVRGEDRLTLTMPETYTPSPPTGVGTDDYRCFLLDPKLDRDSYLTGTNVVPGNPDVVHHVILFRATPDQVDDAERLDAESDDLGWTCFGGSGLPGDFANVNDANWLGAWAPGTKETLTSSGLRRRPAAGSRIVMQVHYNLLAGQSPDMSSTQIRVTPEARRHHPAAHLPAARPGRAAVPARPRRRAVVRPGGRGRRPQGAGRAGPGQHRRHPPPALPTAHDAHRRPRRARARSRDR